MGVIKAYLSGGNQDRSWSYHFKLDHIANKHTRDLTAINEAPMSTLNIHILDKLIHSYGFCLVVWEL